MYSISDPSVTFTYDDSWRPIHAPVSIRYNGSEHNYTYDANGSLTGAPDFSDPYYISFPRTASNSITYNADNMPVRISNRKDDGAMVSTIAVDFTYDGNGTRAKKALSNGDTTYYIGNHFEVANGVETKYIFAGNQRIAKVTTADSYFYHKDHLGSSSVMTDYPDGLTVETTGYLPFGHERDHTGEDVTDYKFTDQEKDTETGLYNYDARMYDPVIALFISADSIIPDYYDPQSLNRYAYCRNNPLKYVDPDGHAYDLIDIGFFVQSAYTFARNPSWSNAGWLAADTVSLAPVVPSLGYGRVATKIAGKVADVASSANKADNSAKSLKALGNTPKTGQNLLPAPNKVDYSVIPDPKNVGVGNDFTLSQKQEALKLNREANQGVVKSDRSAAELVKPQKSQKGVKPDPLEWQFDHKISKNKGGTNSSSNIQITSRQDNRYKSDH